MREYERHALDALTRGPAGFAARPRRGEPVMVARWIGESHGAVLALRLRRDGIWDGTTSLFTRVRDAWELGVEGGGGWPDPTDRPPGRGSGEHIEWFGVTGT